MTSTAAPLGKHTLPSTGPGPSAKKRKTDEDVEDDIMKYYAGKPP